jgi:hypothetical protein
MGTSYVFLVPLLAALTATVLGRAWAPWMCLVAVVAVGLVWFPLECHFVDAFAWAVPGAVAVRAAFILLPMTALLAAANARSHLAFAALAGAALIGASVASCVFQKGVT